MLVRGTLNGEAIVIGSIYAPNSEQDKFLETLSTVLVDWEAYPWIIGGDFNMILDVSLDRSHPPLQNTNSRKLAESLQNWASGWGLGDVWRMHLLKSREYSFFSCPHSLHTRIDRILCSLNIVASVSTTTYLGKKLSDHNPLEITIQWGRVPTPVPTWKLQPALVEDQVFRTTLADATKNYFRENADTAGSCQIEWDAFKTVIRGVAITTKVGARNALIKSISELEEQLGELEKNTTEHDTQRNALQDANIKYVELLEELRVLDYTLYTQNHTTADRAGPLLAHLIKDSPNPTPILEVKTVEGLNVDTQLKINATFQKYYQTLYESLGEPDYMKYDLFFHRVQLPQLLDDYKKNL